MNTYTTISGVELDFDKMTPEGWTLYFTGGSFTGDEAILTVPAATMKLNKADYIGQEYQIFNLWFDPSRSNYNISIQEEEPETSYCNDNGYHLGGFMSTGCELKYLWPVKEGVEYITGFEDESYSTGFIYESEPIDTTEEICKSFNLDFSFDFLVNNCKDYVPTSGLKEFSATEFSLSSIATI